MKLKHLIFTITAIPLILCSEVKDYRKPLKKETHKKTVWAQVNPWFPMNKFPIHDYGGPNVSWIRHEGENIWGQGLKICEKYGLDGWYVECNEPGGWGPTYKKILEEASAVGSNVKIALFYGFYSKTPEESVKGAIKSMSVFRDELKNHPKVGRIDGRPIMVIYNVKRYQPEEWKIIFDGIEKEFGPMVFLFNYRSLTHKGDFKSNIRRYLPYFDGVSNYGSAGTKYQQKCAAVLHEVMKNEFPHKIYEAGVHSTYTCHFHMGGLDVDLSKGYRDSFEIYFKTNPDSINITNLFDHYENSLIYPCYEREDFLLRYMQYRLSLWRNSPFPKQSTPELVVTNYTHVLLGRQNLDFEVIGFPIGSSQKKVKIILDICNTDGKVLYTFPEKTFDLKKLCVERFSIPSEQFASYRGIVPRLRYEWRGKKFQMNHGPMTVISPSIRSYYMYWARSTKNELKTKGTMDWTLNGKHPGETYVPDSTGIGLFQSNLVNKWDDKDKRAGYSRQTIKYDGLEFYSTRNDRLRLRADQALLIPRPGQALHYFHLEMENKDGCKVQTLPVWYSDGSRSNMVEVPILTNSGKIKKFRIEAARVPFFYYPCSEDGGSLLIDHSGYMHNGSINGSGFGGGHLGYTGYNYYHNGPVTPMKQKTLFRKEKNGKGYLRFSGKDYVIIMGGTAFPGASTYELSIRPAEIGKTMGIIGTGNNQIALRLKEDGTIEACRRSEKEGMGGSAPVKPDMLTIVRSKTKAESGKWMQIAVVYDLKKIKLYINGKLESEAESQPLPGHDWINHLIVGASNQWVFTPIEHFKGDIRQIRFYGRNLQPSEFLK